MKKLSLLFLLLLALSSCEDKGASTVRLSGEENNLPAELKGMKVYSVHIGGGSYMKVAVLNNRIVGNTYPEGKHTESVVVIDNSTGKEIQVESILMENDSIVVCRKVMEERETQIESYEPY
jgi:hypothetical protein